MYFPRWTRPLLLVLSVLGTWSGSVPAAEPQSDIEPVVFFDKPMPLLTPAQNQTELSELDRLVDEAITVTSRRYLTGEVHTPWQIMHALLALRSDLIIKSNGEKVQALKWLGEGRTFKGMPLVEQTAWGGRFHTYVEPYAFEGHPNQFLAMLSMCDLPTSHTLNTPSGQPVSIEQMLRHAQMTVNDREEITWTLWSLARYLPVDAQWINAQGEAWSIERLVQIETYAEVTMGACGGTHGLFALALARNSCQAKGRPLRGIWLEADQKIRRYIQTARSLQNQDGTFSTKTFAGPGFSTEFAQRIPSQGHVLEFLMVAMQDRELKEEWLQRAIKALATDLLDHRKAPADCGPLYHALHSLILYRQRTRPADSVPSPVESLVQSEKKAEAEKTKGATEPAGKPAATTTAVEAKPAEPVRVASKPSDVETKAVEPKASAAAAAVRPDAGSAGPAGSSGSVTPSAVTPATPASEEQTAASPGSGGSADAPSGADSEIPQPPTDD